MCSVGPEGKKIRQSSKNQELDYSTGNGEKWEIFKRGGGLKLYFD